MATLCTDTKSRVRVRCDVGSWMQQPTATQHVDNRYSVVFVGTSTAPDSRRFIDGGLGRQLSMGPFYVTQSIPAHQLADPTQPNLIKI